jgi:hypothetical protein
VIAFGEQITINGVVQGDVMAGGQTIVITGSAEDARIAGQVLKLTKTAKLDGDLVAAGFSLECEPGSTISRDVLFAGFQTLLAGKIDRDVRAGIVNARLAGEIGGRVDLEIGGNQGEAPPPQFGPPPPIAFPKVPGGLSIADTAAIKGELSYLAAQAADVAEGATLPEKVEHRTPPPAAAAAPPTILDHVVSRARHAASVVIVGLFFVLLFPRWTAEWTENIRTRPAACLAGGATGFAVIVGLFFLAILAIVLAAIFCGLTTLYDLLPLVIVGGIVSYLALIVFVWLLAAFLAEALGGLALGRSIVKGEHLPARLGALLLGVLIVVAVLSVPYLGGLVGFVLLLLAIGGIVLWLFTKPVAVEAKTVA